MSEVDELGPPMCSVFRPVAKEVGGRSNRTTPSRRERSTVWALTSWISSVYEIKLTRCWHVTISCQPDGRPPQPVRPWKSGRVHLAEGSNVFVLELPYSTEFRRDSRKFASGVRKYGKFSHFLTHSVVYGGQGKKQILSFLCVITDANNVGNWQDPQFFY